MTLLFFLALASAAVAFSVWTYRTRELPIAGRGLLAAVRCATLILILLLLFDPRLPAPGGDATRWVLLDASESMAVGPTGAGAAAVTPWDSAVARARSLRDGGARVLRFGADLPVPPADSALAPPPSQARSLLLPALERAAESGARAVIVLSDLRLEDPVAVRAALDRLGLGARFEPVGGSPRNAGVAELDLPGDLAEGEPVVGRVTVFASGAGTSDSLRLEVREEDRLVASVQVPLPTEGRVLAVPLSLPAPSASGATGTPDEIRYQATVELTGDEFPADDRAVSYAVVDPREGTLVAVSLAPDWELRHLLPVLARATGLPARGFLRAGDRYFPTLAGGERATPVDSAEVAQRVRAAQLVVLHGVGAGAPAWVREAAARAPRVLIFASDPAGALAAGVRVGPPRPGEWYPDPQPPPSPLAGELGGLAYQAFPPLLGLMPRTGVEGGVAPIDVRLRGTGPAESPLVLRERAGGRTAVVLASGWWRWALRPGDTEQAYARVWSGVAGWLLEGGSLASQRLRPVQRVLRPDAPIEWTPPAATTELVVYEADGERVVLDTTLTASAEGVRTPALPVGSYRYRAGAGSDSASGRFDVHALSAELRHPRMSVPDSVPAPPDRPGSEGPGRPLRAHPVPYLLLLGLLCGEWVGRRKKGLR